VGQSTDQDRDSKLRELADQIHSLTEQGRTEEAYEAVLRFPISERGPSNNKDKLRSAIRVLDSCIEKLSEVEHKLNGLSSLFVCMFPFSLKEGIDLEEAEDDEIRRCLAHVNYLLGGAYWGLTQLRSSRYAVQSVRVRLEDLKEATEQLLASLDHAQAV
jgi:hypothetical protein